MGELGTRLRETREARGLTVEDAERDTRISRRYLQALEAEQFEVIPAPVYARGFLRSYAQYLGLDPREMLLLFPGEDDDPAFSASRSAPKPSRENPLPPTSRSRPTWSRPGAPPTSARAPSPRAPAPADRTRPRRAAPPPGGAFPGTRREPPVVVPETPHEPTIGIDIGVAVPARRLDHDPAASTRTALVIVAAAAAIAAVVGLAWLISRAAGDDGPGVLPTTTSETGAAAATPTGSLPSVPRGVVPEVRGLPAGDAALLIAAAGYEVSELLEKSPNVTRGVVFDQSPAPDTQLPEGQVVHITVSDGP